MPSKDYEEPKKQVDEMPQPENPQVRELDLTDKLNKNLLQSFLSRLNQSDEGLKKFMVPNTNSNSDNNFE